MGKLEITGLEANVLLYALDLLYEVNSKGKLTQTEPGYTLEALQDLRDRLFAAHEHPDD